MLLKASTIRFKEPGSRSLYSDSLEAVSWGFEDKWRRDFPHLSMRAVGLTKPLLWLLSAKA
jgi:hypothetical protein